MKNKAEAWASLFAGRRDARRHGLASLGLLISGALLAASPAQAQNYSVLYSFQCGPGDGSEPISGLVSDAAGNLYGTTDIGGTFDFGTVFELSGSGQETVIYSFAGPPKDGQSPAYTSLVRDSAGNLYGTTPNGGLTDHGTVYKLTPAGVETVLHSFGDTGGDGWFPYAGLILDARGHLYGTTSEGGDDYGTAFEVFVSGGEFPLYRFLGAQQGDGDEPFGGLIRDPEGNLYGTTYEGGLYSEGSVFKLSPAHQRTELYSFKGGTDSAGPFAGLLASPAGSFYGTTQMGGSSNDGTVFEVSATGKEHVLYSFKGMPDGALPYAGLAGR